MEKLNYRKNFRGFVQGGIGPNIASSTLELQLNFFQVRGSYVNILCEVLTGPDSLPHAIISRMNGCREKFILRTKIKFPEQVKINLSNKEIVDFIKTNEHAMDVSEFNSDATEYTKTSNDQKFMDKILELIQENLSDDTYWVDNLAADMGVSRSTLFRKLKSITGMSPQEFMRKQRLDKAVALLEQGPLRISDVAYQVGFSDPNYFSKWFRKFFGTSPTNYIADHASGDSYQMTN